MMIQEQVDFLFLLQRTGPVARAVLAVLALFSVWSWGIILSKLLMLRKVAGESEKFWKIFRKGQTLSEIATACEALRFTPLVPVLASAMDIGNSRALGSPTALNHTAWTFVSSRISEKVGLALSCRMLPVKRMPYGSISF